MKILLVDDEVLVTRATSRAITAGHPEWIIDTAEGGEAALHLLQENEYDCIVSDVQMPHMNGVELLKRVSELYPATGRIILSGQAENRVAMDAINPMHRYLSKPCDTRELVYAIENTTVSRKLCNDPAVSVAIGGESSLPTLPKIYQDVCREIEDPESSAVSVGKIIKQDPSVTTKILQVVNSALFGATRKISSIEQAVSILGYSLIRSLVLTCRIFDSKSKPIEGFSIERVFTHSFQTGLLAREICVHEKLTPAETETAFTAGLLHDVGKIILFDRLPDRLAEIIALAKKKAIPQREAELEVLQCDHAAIGASLLQTWGLPHELVEAVTMHHAPEVLNPVNPTHLTNLVFAANAIAHAGHFDRTLGKIRSFFPEPEAVTLVERLQNWRAVCEQAGADA